MQNRHIGMILGILCLLAAPHAAHAQYSCLQSGLMPGSNKPVLPFYQPMVQPSDAPKIINGNVPAENQFTLYNGWSTGPLAPVKTWWSGLFDAIPYRKSGIELMQWGTADAYGHSSLLVQGTMAGMWMNSMDGDTRLPVQGKSGSMNVGCWYFTPNALPPLFGTMASAVDVSFDTNIAYDGSMGGATQGGVYNDEHFQVYYDMLVRDRTCYATHANDRNKDAACGLNLTVSVYTTRISHARDFAMHGDDGVGSASLAYKIIATGIDAPEACGGACPVGQNWFTRMPDSTHFVTRPTNNLHVHFQIPAAKFANLLRYAQTKVPTLSLDPLHYDFATLNVIGEGADPCYGSADASCAAASHHAQLGMSVANFRVISTVPHQAVLPGKLFNDWATRIVFLDASQRLQVMSLDGPSDTFTAPFQVGVKADPAIAPLGHMDAGAVRIAYADTARHLHESFFDAPHSRWIDWDMTTNLLPKTDVNAAMAGAPVTAMDSAGTMHVIYISRQGHLYDYAMTKQGKWSAMDLSNRLGLLTKETLAVGHPAINNVQGALRVDYRTATGQIIEAWLAGDTWHAFNLSDGRHTAAAATDPIAVSDPAGQQRLFYIGKDGGLNSIYLDVHGWQYDTFGGFKLGARINGQLSAYADTSLATLAYLDAKGDIHALTYAKDAWTDNDLTASVLGALPAVAGPTVGVGLDNAARIVYATRDRHLHAFQLLNGKWVHRDL